MEHPAFTLAAVLPAGGAMAFMKTRSAPSLIAGVALGAAYGYAGTLMKKNADGGAEIAAAASAVLTGAGVVRSAKTAFKKPVPLGLAGLGLISLAYYGNKVRQFHFGV
ncbi:hypothetical protein YB2330_003075 [Saitoella coloradoensis]